jgi:hypothetical protein
MSDIQTPPAEAPASTSAAPSASVELRSTVCAASGLPEALASRLQGATLGELLTDARALAATLAPAAPAAEAAASTPPDLSSLTVEQRAALTAAGVDLAALGASPTPTEADGFGGGTRREARGGMTRASIALLAKTNPDLFNAKVESGEIRLGDITR